MKILIIIFLILTGCVASEKTNTHPNTNILFEQAYSQFQIKNYAVAKILFEQYCQLDTSVERYETFAFLAECYNQLGQLDSGKVIYSNAISMVTANHGAYLENAITEIVKWSQIYPDFPKELSKDGGFNLINERPALIVGARPKYPDSAKIRGLEGKVLLKILIDESGRPIKIFISESSDSIFNDSAIEGVQQIQLEPPKRYGRPAKLWITYPMVFRLK